MLPSRQLIKRELDAGKLGEPGLIRIHHWEETPPFTPASRALPTVLLQEIDCVLWLMGKSPTTVFALENTGSGPRPRWDRYPGSRYLQVHLGFPEGAMALLDFSSLHPPGDPYRSLHVIGSLGAAYVDDHQNMQLLYGWGQPRAVVASQVQGLATGGDFTDMIGAWENVLTVAAAVERSIQSCQAVSLEGR